MRGLNCRDVDLTLSDYYYVIRGFGRADLDREDEGPLAGGGHPLVRRSGFYVLFHLEIDLNWEGLG